MAGSFPGMDPYIETPLLWHGAHNALITYLTGGLNAVLPAPYVASVEMRCYIERPNVETNPALIVPDVAVLPQTSSSFSLSGGTATLSLPSPAAEFEVDAREVKEAYIDVLNMEDGQRVVTSIELLSHPNKTTRDKGRKLYREKQRTLLTSDTSLLEMDLLCRGRHTAAVPNVLFRSEHAHDYLICLHRAWKPERFTVWFNRVREPLPTILIPLDEGIAEIVLPLQPVFDRFYEAGAYARRIDYRREPEPPLSEADATWADALLRERGLRS